MSIVGFGASIDQGHQAWVAQSAVGTALGVRGRTLEPGRNIRKRHESCRLHE